MIKLDIDRNGVLQWAKITGRILFLHNALQLAWDYYRIHHNNNGPAYNDSSDYIVYMINGKRHRVGGPAVQYHMYKEWYINGNRHRLDGPAVEYGTLASNEWWINGVEYDTELEYWIAVQNYDKTYNISV